MEKSDHIHSLDALRGLAALTVVFGHAALALPAMYAAETGGDSTSLALFLTRSPLHILWAGHEAVILFFVLSGFVLTLPFLRGDTVNYKMFALKRVCRIYIPYIVVVAGTMLLRFVVPSTEQAGLSAWFNEQWPGRVTWFTVVDHLLMFNQTRMDVDSVTWSLVHEMRVSLLFPLLVAGVRRLRWQALVPLSAISALAALAMQKFFPFPAAVWSTWYYGSFFAIGSCLALNRDYFRGLIGSLSTRFRPLLWVVALALYIWQWIVPPRSLLINTAVADWMTMLGVVLILMLTLTGKRIERTLQAKPLLWLGKISYSLYLTHLVVLLTLVHTLHPQASTPVILLAFVPVALLVAAIVHLVVELPAIRLGKLLTQSKKPDELPNIA